MSTTIFMGTVSYLYFTDSFNEEVEKVHRRMLDNVNNTVREQVFYKVQTQYVNLTSNRKNYEDMLLFFDQPLEGNNAKIHEAHQQLKYIVNASGGLLDSVAIYYRSNRMMISSNDGYQSYAKADAWEPLEWMDRLDFSAGHLLWTDQTPSSLSRNADVISLVASYPYVQNDANEGYIVFHVNKSIIASILRGVDRSGEGKMLVAGPGGIVVSNEERDPAIDASLLSLLASDGDSTGNRIEELEGREHLVSYRPLYAEGWRLLSVTPVDEFYSKSYAIQQMLLWIGLVAILLGVVVSNVFTNRIYHPLRKLMDRTKHLFSDGQAPRRDHNEYVQINDLIDNLSIKVGQLERTLESNLPLVKHSLVSGLLHSTIKHRTELDERLGMLGLRMSAYSIAAFQIRLSSDAIERMTTENAQFVIYHLIEVLESANTKEMFALAIETSPNCISGVACSNAEDTAQLMKRMEHLQTYAYANFMLPTAASIGGWRKDPLETEPSFRQAAAYLRYRYLFPDRTLFCGDAWETREQSERMLESRFVNQFAKALKNQDAEAASGIVRNVGQELRTGSYALQYAMLVQNELVHTARQYATELNAPIELPIPEAAAGSGEGFTHWDEFERRLCEAVVQAIASVKERNGQRSMQIIDRVKSYISEHLDGDLSLNAVSEHVGLSPAYVSKLFKSTTGENFVEYVTNARVAKARELIQTTEENIEQIALKVGYYNPAYFTKKFKETFGMTPSDLRMKLQAE
ncbi:AraC family transcriptional regulator [Paenibacillus sp. TRM 82003]|nr:AraC family transcriptional regulator [Paenibacillus sp. TRM 82003]